MICWHLLNALHHWWAIYPALLYSIAMAIGYGGALFPGWHLVPPLLLFLGPLVPAYLCGLIPLVIRLSLAILLSATCYLHGCTLQPLLPSNLDGWHGPATILFLRRDEHPKIKKSLYKAIATINSQNSFPVLVSLSKPPLPEIGSRWTTKGILRKRGSSLSFIPDKPIEWNPQTSTMEGFIARWREKSHLAISSYLYNSLDNARAAPFLTGMVTGLFDDPLLRNHFARFGLQHLLAISGFHFSIIATCLSFALRLLMPYRLAIPSLLICLALYCSLLGYSPSVMRAWISISVGLAALLTQRRSTPLNSMGIALIAILLIDPFCLPQPGFQCSFAITASILLFAGPCDRALEWLVRKRRLQSIVRWDTTTQHGYIGASMIREALALNIAVNVTALPLMLYHFQNFPIPSLLYNLFFPLLVSLSMMLLIIGSFLELCLEPLGQLIHLLNSYYTHYLIGIAVDAPPAFDWLLYYQLSPLSLSLCLTTIALCGAILQLKKNHKETLNILPENI